MPTSFPYVIDAFPNPSSTTLLEQPGLKHSDQHSNTNDAIKSLETKIGVNFSNTRNSIDYICNLFLMTQGQHQAGEYREIEYAISPPINITAIRWYTDSSKTTLLVSKEFTYGGSCPVLPTAVVLNLYDGTALNLIERTITDTITYLKVFELSRTRIVS
jgi:hypothetical protein